MDSLHLHFHVNISQGGQVTIEPEKEVVKEAEGLVATTAETASVVMPEVMPEYIPSEFHEKIMENTTPKVRECNTCGEVFPHDRRFFFWLDEARGILLNKCIKCQRAKRRCTPKADEQILADMGILQPGVTIENKTCKRCSIEKPISEFYHQKIARDGYQAICKVCFKSAYNE